MPHYYRLPNAAVSAISVDQVEHRVDDDGLLVVEQFTPNLLRELVDMGAKQTEPPTDEEREAMKADRMAAAAEEDEKAELFRWLDEALGHRIDRRRSVQQLRKMWSDYQEKQRGRQLTGAGALAEPSFGEVPDV